MAAKPTEIGSTKMFDGYNKRYKHYSPALGCSMNFHIYFPPSSSDSQKFPVLYWLSGLTCSDENFIIKSGAQRTASSESVALIVPDTSPRGLNVEGESDSWDFGVGAGFYLNATQEKWKNWQMYDYIVKELPALLKENFPQLDTSRASISGHSMGGHGALTIYLKNLDKYKSVSAFAPIANPVNCPWGQKAFTSYLGDDRASWQEYDATHLVSKYKDVSATILIDQGDADKFLLEQQLLPNKFEEACREAKVPLLLRMQEGERCSGSKNVALVIGSNNASGEQRYPYVVPISSGSSIAEIDMEVSDDLMRAGGLGATDDITSVLPTAGDFTDCEAHLIEIEDLEDDDTPVGKYETSGKVNNLEAKNAQSCQNPSSINEYEAVHMEDMIRAGGFGATDDINNFLPVASDFTDFEAHLRDTEDYEDHVKEVTRHGLGWIKGAD